MKFSCERCNTRYSIADERVRGKILKIRCKTCAAVISVREGMDDGSGSSAGLNVPSSAALGVPSSATIQLPAVEPPPSLHEEWFVSIDGNQEGPFGLAHAQAWIAARSPTEELFCWSEGFDDWLPVEKVSHFRGLRAAAPAAKADSRPTPRVDAKAAAAAKPVEAKPAAAVKIPDATPVEAKPAAAPASNARAEGSAPRPLPKASEGSGLRPLPKPGEGSGLRPLPKPDGGALKPLPALGAKAEAPKAEAPKAEAPKAEAPKAEAPKAEAPKAEAPKAEAPKSEAPKAEAPKAEAPKVEAPKAEAPKAEPPAAKAEPPAAKPEPPAAKPEPLAAKPAAVEPPAPAPSTLPAGDPSLSPVAAAIAAASAPFTGAAAPALTAATSTTAPPRVAPGPSSPPPAGSPATAGVKPAGSTPAKPAARADAGKSNGASAAKADEDDLSIGEVSRVLRLADLGAERAKRPRKSANQAPVATPQPASFEPSPLDDAGSSASIAVPTSATTPSRRPVALYVLLALISIGAIAAIVYVATRGGGDDEQAVDVQPSSDDYSGLGRRIDVPGGPPQPGSATVPGSGSGSGSTAGTGGGSVRRPGGGSQRPGGSGSGSAVVEGPGSGSGSQTGPVGLTALEPDEVLEMSQKMSFATRRCYDHALKADPFLKAPKIVATIKIAASGVVDNVQLSKMTGTTLGTCLEATIRRWKFRPSTEGIISDISMIFGPG